MTCEKCGGTRRVPCEYEGPVKLAPCDAPPSCPPGADDDCRVPCTCADDGGGHFKFTGNATTPRGGRYEVHLGGKVYDMTLTERVGVVTGVGDDSIQSWLREQDEQGFHEAAAHIDDLERALEGEKARMDRLWDVLTVCYKADFRKHDTVEAIKARDLSALERALGAHDEG